MAKADNPRQFTDAEDDVPGEQIVRRAATVFRWREAYQAEFAARMDWCVKPESQCSRPPKAELVGPASRRVRAGEMATVSVRTDGENCRWFAYPDEAGVEPNVLSHNKLLGATERLRRHDCSR